VDIPPTAPIHRDGLVLSYQAVPCTIAADPRAIRVDCPSGSHAEIDGIRYVLAQFHLHCPSEHTFGGSHTPAALHLVHQSAAGGLAVVAVMLVTGQANPAVGALVAALEGTEASGTIDPASLLPDDRAYVAYEGSLTTPPYTEGVAWRVLIHPVELSAEQLAALEAVHHDNNRPVQPLHDRAFR
jgi:carbonic anhydrase